MKKTKSAILLSLVLCLTMSMILNVHAQDVWGENIDVVAWHKNNDINGATGYGRTTAYGLHTRIYNQTTLYDMDYQEEGFGQSSSTNPNTESVSSFAVGKNFSVGMFYTAESAGVISIPSVDGEYTSRYSDSDSFRYGYDSRTSVEASREYEELHLQYRENLANYLFEKFNMDPSQFKLAFDYELCMNYGIDDSAYLFARETMERPYRSTVPSFFVNEANSEFFAVYQDPDAVCYMYDYVLDEGGNWYINDARRIQDCGQYRDICQSFSEFATAALAIDDNEMKSFAVEETDDWETELLPVDLASELQDAELGVIGENVSDDILQRVKITSDNNSDVAYTIKNLGNVSRSNGGGTIYSITATSKEKSDSDSKNEDNVHCYMTVTWVDNLGTKNELRAVSGGWDTERTLTDKKVVYGVDGKDTTKTPSGISFSYTNIGQEGRVISATMSANSKGYTKNPIELTISPSILS